MVTTQDHTWTATERQAQVLKIIAEAPEGSTSIIGYGGAAGGAKTNLDANLALEIALACPGSRTLVGRQDFVDLRTTTMAEFDRCIPPGLDVVFYNSGPVYRDVRRSADVPYSRVYFRSLQNWQSILSDEFGWVIIDEGQEVAEQAVLGLLTRLRHMPERKWGIVTTFNPFPSWPVDWFMRDSFSEDAKAQFALANVKLHFVPSRIDDNPHLRPGYKAMLEATLDPFMRAVMVDGDPDAAMQGFLYFDMNAIKELERYAVDPVEKRELRPEPGRPADGELLIWERPLIRETYYAGADTADGKAEELMLLPEKGGSDRNACAIYKLRDNTQVAAIYGRQEEHMYARTLAEVCGWYNNACLCVERNRRSVLSNLRGLGYPNLYYTLPPQDMHLAGFINPTRRLEYGFNTDVKTRPLLLSDLREMWSMQVMRPRDKATFEEARDFLAAAKPQAREGKHDDRIFAHALAVKARQQAERSKVQGGNGGIQHMSTSITFGGNGR